MSGTNAQNGRPPPLLLGRRDLLRSAAIGLGVEEYGMRRYFEFAPNPDQQLELRRFNFRLRRA
jgi:hypothetical protein